MAPWRFLRGAFTALLTAGILALATPALAQETRSQSIAPRAPTPTGIVVNLPARTLYWYVGGNFVRAFPVGIGKSSTETPLGSYRVQNKAVHPWWYPPSGGKPVPPGPANPLGTRWIGFSGGYGIHGNNNPASIGGAVSLGCVRMYIPDVEWLYEQVSVGTPVNVVYETVQVQYGPGGTRYLAIHPDVYGVGRPSVDKVLRSAGLEAGAVTATAPGLYPLDATAAVNGRNMPAIIHKGKPYVAARSLGDRMFARVGWHPGTQQVSLDGQMLPTVLRDGTGYIDAASAAAVLGVTYRWNGDSLTVTLEGRPLFLGGHLLARIDAHYGQEGLLLPVRQVAEAVGAFVGWDGQARKALVNGQHVESVLIAGRAWAPARHLAQLLDLQLRITDQGIYLD